MPEPVPATDATSRNPPAVTFPTVAWLFCAVLSFLSFVAGYEVSRTSSRKHYAYLREQDRTIIEIKQGRINDLEAALAVAQEARRKDDEMVRAHLQRLFPNEWARFQAGLDPE